MAPINFFKYIYKGIVVILTGILDFFAFIGEGIINLFTPSKKNKNVKNEIKNERVLKVREKEKKKERKPIFRKREKKDVEMNMLLIDFEGVDAIRSKKKLRYKYTVKDKNENVINGTFDAFSKVDVHSFLLSQGYTVYEIEEDKLSNLFGLAQISYINKLRAKDLSFFLTQLSTYIKAGLPLVDSIRILSNQSKGNKKLLYQKLVYELNTGVAFSEALAKQGKVFPRLLVNMVKTAEMTGNLSEILDDMADYYHTIDSNRKQVISAMTYPSVIFVMAIIILTFIMLYVIPEFVSIYGEANANIPPITLIVIAISDFFQANGSLVLLGVLIVILAFALMYKNITSFRYTVQWILMHIPVVKTIMIDSEVVMFTKTFASLINHDVLITDTMEILSRITNNEIYKQLISDTISNLKSGKEISLAFKNHWAFPSVAYEMLVTGEKTGRMGPMMETVANYYSEQQKTVVTQLKSLIEPILIVGLALVVGVILLSVVLPMFNLYGQVIE